MSEDPNFNTRKQKSFDYSSEATKQLITIATAITIFTVTFSKDIAGTTPGSMPDGNKLILAVSWAYYFISIIGGLFTIYALASQLDNGEAQQSLDSKPSVWNRPVSFLMKFQQISFVLGLIFTAMFGVSSLYRPLLIGAAIVLAIISAMPLAALCIFSVLKMPADVQSFYAHVESKDGKKYIAADEYIDIEEGAKFKVYLLPKAG